MPIPHVDTYDVVPETKVLEATTYVQLASPARVYKQPVSYKTLRGSVVRGIGEEHASRDSPMMIEGRFRIREVRENRLKVSGLARA